MTKRRGILLGGGAFARETLAWALDYQKMFGVADIQWTAFLDNSPGSMSGFDGISMEWLGAPSDYVPAAQDVILIGIGDPHAKKALVEKYIDLGAQFHTLIHPTAVVSDTATLGRGVVIGPHAYIATHATLGDGVCVNSLTGVGHDATVGKYATISSQVDITGAVIIGDRVFIGSGARILPGITVEVDAKVGAGAVVVRNVKTSRTVYAQPARTL